MQSKLISIGTESKKFDDDCDGIDEAMTEIDVENHYYIYNYHRQNVSQPDHFLFQTKSLDCSVQKIFEQKKDLLILRKSSIFGTVQKFGTSIQ